MIKKTEDGVCPRCGSINIDWGYTELDSPFMFYPATCANCGAEFTEVYKLVYDGYNMDDEDGKEHLFDAEGNEL